MLKILLINSIVIFITAKMLRGVDIDDFFTALGVSILLAIINTLIKPLIVFITLPVTVLTLGLFLLVINGAIILLIDKLVEGFKVKNFGWAILYSIVISILNGFLLWVFG